MGNFQSSLALGMFLLQCAVLMRVAGCKLLRALEMESRVKLGEGEEGGITLFVFAGWLSSCWKR